MKRNQEIEIEKKAEECVYEIYKTPQVVDPYLLANHFKIKVYKGEFEDQFKGLIRCKNGMFNIYMNMSILKNSSYEFARYTCAHEVGHALIPAHRKLLMSGVSLAFNPTSEYEISNEVKNEYELQAQSFAAALLMPSEWLKKYSLNQELSLIFLFKNLKDKFKTSLTSTAVRCVKLNLIKGVFIRIGQKVWATQSESFIKTIGKRRIYLKYQESRNRNLIQCRTVELGGYNYELSYLNLSSWSTNISQGSSQDFLVKEEILYTPRYLFCLLTIQD